MDEMQWLIWLSVRCNAEFGNGLTMDNHQRNGQVPIFKGGYTYIIYTRVRRWLDFALDLWWMVNAEGGKELWIMFFYLFKN